MKLNLRRSLIQICMLAVALLASPSTVQAQFTYTNNNGTLTITGYTGAGSAVTIPASINGLPVTGIGYQAFWAKDALTSVTIPDSVTSIGGFAFGLCTAMTNVAMSNNITNIGADAFAVTGLTSLRLPENLQVLGSSAFLGCRSLTSVTIPDDIATLEIQLFAECTGLTNVIIGNGITKIGIFAFAYCEALKTITIPGGVLVIEGGAFEACSNLASVSIPDSVVNIAAWYGALSEEGAFTDCTGLTNVTLGGSVTNIGELSFAGCASLRAITIPATLVSIGEAAFGSCPSLTNITVDPLNPNYSSLDGVLFDKNKTTLIQCPEGKVGKYFIPNSVANVGYGAFESCFSLNSIIIGASVTNFGFLPFGLNGEFSGFYFRGDAPTDFISAFAPEYTGATNATIYYLPTSAGWSNTFAGLPTTLWLPQAQTGDAGFGVRTNEFGFNIAWASGQTVVAEACTNLIDPIWSPLGTNTLMSDSSYFSDPQWTNYPVRFYRLRSP